MSSPCTSPLLDERAVVQLAECLLQLGLRVHHDRSVPGDRLFDRLARYQQEADSFLAGLHRYLVAAVKYDERAVSGSLTQEDLAPVHGLFGEYAERLRGRAESSRALEDISEGVPPGLDRQNLPASRRNPNIEIARIGGNAFDGAAPAPEITAHDPHARAVVIDDFRNLGGLDVLVTRRRHLQRRRPVR